MENASKALIIAGAILLSILIIALGIYVFNMSKGVTDTKAIDDLEVSQFNQKFTVYRGKRRGAEVISLLDELISNATSNKDAEERLPDLIYYDNRSSNSLGSAGVSGSSAIPSEVDKKSLVGYSSNPTNSFAIITSTTNQGSNAFSILRSKISEKHTYTVEFDNNKDTGLVEYVIIAY